MVTGELRIQKVKLIEPYKPLKQKDQTKKLQNHIQYCTRMRVSEFQRFLVEHLRGKNLKVFKERQKKAYEK